MKHDAASPPTPGELLDRPKAKTATLAEENKEARSIETGFSCRKRRYANLGHLLPMFYIEQAVNPVCRPSQGVD